jgi:hypothetical protein
MTKRKKYQTLAPPINYWFIITIILGSIFFYLVFLLIQERLFLQNAQIYLQKYKVYLNGFSNINSKIISSHLFQPTDPSSSSDIIYVLPESFSYK